MYVYVCIYACILLYNIIYVSKLSLYVLFTHGHMCAYIIIIFINTIMIIHYYHIIGKDGISVHEAWVNLGAALPVSTFGETNDATC